MRQHSLRRKAILTFLVSGLIFVWLTTTASRLYIDYVTTNFMETREFSNAFIKGEFAKIIRFYAETDPEKLVTSDILTLYSAVENDNSLAIVFNDDVIFGRVFYSEYASDKEAYEPYVEIFKTGYGDNEITVIEKRPEPDSNSKGRPLPYRRIDLLATSSYVAYLLILIVIFMFFINRILKPLEEVKIAAREIKEGNLNYKIEYSKKDEIGEVFDAIEEMRNELKEASDIREQYEKNRNELLSNITHDLKTPITSIKGYVEGIIDGVADTPEKIQKYAKTIYKHSVDMDALINDLFLMSKLDVDQMAFHFETFDLTEFLQDCYDDFVFELTSKNIQFALTGNVEEPVLIEGDRQTLKRVMINIIQNSLHHLDKAEKSIKITLETDDKNAVITVRDNGKGIPKESLKDIFKRFYRVDDARGSGYGGSGIGLSIVEKIVEKHGGQIVAESESGLWTEMVITLPIESEA